MQRAKAIDSERERLWFISKTRLGSISTATVFPALRRSHWQTRRDVDRQAFVVWFYRTNFHNILPISIAQKNAFKTQPRLPLLDRLLTFRSTYHILHPNQERRFQFIIRITHYCPADCRCWRRCCILKCMLRRYTRPNDGYITYTLWRVCCRVRWEQAIYCIFRYQTANAL